MNEIQRALQAHITQLEMADPQDDALFHKLIRRTMELTNLDIRTMADRFDMSKPSLELWIKGSHAPHPVMRTNIYKRCISEMQKVMPE